MKNYNLKIIGEQTEFGNLNMLESYTFSNGRKLPYSYINFVKKYGYGLAVNLFHIYIPMEISGDSLMIRAEEIKSTYYEDLLNNDIWFGVAPDISIETLKNLYPFASSDNGHYLFWDINTITDIKEMDIYITDFRGLEFKKISLDLYEFFDKITDEKMFKQILPFSTQQLPNTFQTYRVSELN